MPCRARHDHAPQLCSNYTNSPRIRWDRMVCQEKVDGIRAVFTRDADGQPVALSRHGTLLSNCTHLVDVLEPHLVPGVSLDGELFRVSWGATMGAVFSENPRRLVGLRLFDRVDDGQPHQPLADRLEELARLPPLPHVEVLPTRPVGSHGEAMRLVKQVARNRGEGIVLKDLAAVYRPGSRGFGWHKLKLRVTSDLPLVSGDYRERTLTVRLPSAVEQTIFHVRTEIWGQLRRAIGRGIRLDQLAVECSFLGRSALGGQLRHPVGERLRWC